MTIYLKRLTFDVKYAIMDNNEWEDLLTANCGLWDGTLIL